MATQEAKFGCARQAHSPALRYVLLRRGGGVMDLAIFEGAERPVMIEQVQPPASMDP